MNHICNLLMALVLIIVPQNAISENKKFVFGISAPLSGVLAEYGAAVKNGVQLALEERAASFSNIEIIFEDSQWDPKTAINAFNALKDIKGANLIYNWGAPTSDAVAPIAQRIKFPIIAMSPNPKITENGNYVIRSLRSAQELGELIGTYLVNKGHKKIGLLVAENSYVQGLYQGLEDYVQANGGTVENLGNFDPAILDFKTSILKLKQKQYDALGIFLITGQIRSFFKQSKDLGIKLPQVFGADFFASETEIAASGSAIDGAVFPDLGVTKEFRNRYKSKFGNDIQIAFAANAYDVTGLVAETFNSLDLATLNNDKIVELLRSSKPFSGAHGNFAFEQSPKFGPAFVSKIIVRRIEGGEIVDLR